MHVFTTCFHSISAFLHVYYLSVQVLQLENNRLEILPESIGDLPNLVKLDISTNMLRFLPPSMVRES